MKLLAGCVAAPFGSQQREHVMKFRVSIGVAMAATFCIAFGTPSWGRQHTAKVASVQALYSSQDCILFTLAQIDQLLIL